MARKSAPPRRTGARQDLARRKVLSYVRRLGLRKAANRLEASVKDLRSWLEKGFPTHKVAVAIGLGKPGGQHVYVRGTKLAQLIKQKGVRVVATLTGIPGAQLKEQAKRRPNSTVKFDRDRLRKTIKAKGAEKLASTLGTKISQVTNANKLPLTEATRRLARFAKHFGATRTAEFLGLSQKQLAGWLKKGIPTSWERDVDRLIGKRIDQGPDEATVKKSRPAKQIERAIKSARNQATAWNKKVPHRFRISLKNAERWARLGTFASRLEAARSALAAAKKPQKPTSRRPPPKKRPPKRPPPRPPAPPPPPSEIGEAPKPPKPPEKPPKETPETIADDTRRDFHQARVEAFIEGRYPKPESPWGRLARWCLINRYGIRLYKRVEQFVHEIDLDKLGTEIIQIARKVWHSLRGPLELMTIRFTFSAKGDGNPFYPDAFVEGDHVNFFTRNIRIYSEEEIENQIRDILNEIYVVDVQYVMLFLEYVEFVKSLPIPPEEQKPV